MRLNALEPEAEPTVMGDIENGRYFRLGKNGHRYQAIEGPPTKPWHYWAVRVDTGIAIQLHYMTEVTPI